MSKEIDLTQALSDEDREWLLARGREADVLLADSNAKAAAEIGEGSDSDDGDSDDSGGEPDADPYEGMLKADLQAECENRGLSPRGTVEELVARLREADEAVNTDG